MTQIYEIWYYDSKIFNFQSMSVERGKKKEFYVDQTCIILKLVLLNLIMYVIICFLFVLLVIHFDQIIFL